MKPSCPMCDRPVKSGNKYCSKTHADAHKRITGYNLAMGAKFRKPKPHE